MHDLRLLRRVRVLLSRAGIGTSVRKCSGAGGTSVAVALLLAAMGSVGCAGDGPRPLDWSITYAEGDELLADRTTVVEAVIWQGGCSGERLFDVMLRRGSMPMQPEPPVLDAGVYGFAGHARDSSCRVIAEACEAVDLPQDGPLVLRLRASDSRAVCPEERCRDGECIRRDAGGTPDAGGMDAAQPDGGATDAGSAMDDAGAAAEAGRDGSSDAASAGG